MSEGFTHEQKEVYAEGLQMEALANFLNDAVAWNEAPNFDTRASLIKFSTENGNTWIYRCNDADRYILGTSKMGVAIAMGKMQVAVNKNLFDQTMWSTQYMHKPPTVRTYSTKWKPGDIYTYVGP